MRTTLDIDDDVLAAVKELAARSRTTSGRVLSELARRGLTRQEGSGGTTRNGFQVLHARGATVTTELVKRLSEG